MIKPNRHVKDQDMKSRIVFFIFAFFLMISEAQAKAEDFASYFEVDMKISLPNLDKYIKKLNSTEEIYDRGYISRFDVGNKFKQEFSRTIKLYGQSERRLKTDYEDDLLEVISWLPKESYQYIGPMLHEVPGMSEKILNLPGIKETKNQFPKDIAEPFKNMEDMEYMSPALYFLLMPEIWERDTPEDLDAPQVEPVRKKKVSAELPDYLKKLINVPVKAKKMRNKPKQTTNIAQRLGLRTVYPSLTSTLTSKDVEAFIPTIDMVMSWGMENKMQNYMQLMVGEALLNMWEQDQHTDLPQNDLKDAVNPCQRLVLKTRFAGLYESFAKMLAPQGFSPEEWAYTCDRTIKAFRIAESNLNVAYAVRFHRQGYYNHYIDKLPERWRKEMYATEEAIIKMFTAKTEDVAVVRPFKNDILKKITKIRGVMLTAPIIY